jgi:hypothetical protein
MTRVGFEPTILPEVETTVFYGKGNLLLQKVLEYGKCRPR